MIHIVGGSGYLGSHLRSLLHADGIQFRTYDLRAPTEYQALHTDFDSRKDSLRCAEEDTVIMLAGLPREPKGMEGDPLVSWQRVYRDVGRLMCRSNPRRIVYVSSAQVVYPAGGPSIYANNKAALELWYAEEYGQALRIIRPGTVWGGFGRGLPVRTDTAINRHLATGVALTDDYRAYTAHIDDVVADIIDAARLEDCYGPPFVTCDLPCPTVPNDLTQFPMAARAIKERAAAVGTPLDESYRKWYEDFYGLPA